LELGVGGEVNVGEGIETAKIGEGGKHRKIS
jgi:hypothetical protein